MGAISGGAVTRGRVAVRTASGGVAARGADGTGSHAASSMVVTCTTSGCAGCSTTGVMAVIRITNVGVVLRAGAAIRGGAAICVTSVMAVVRGRAVTRATGVGVATRAANGGAAARGLRDACSSAAGGRLRGGSGGCGAGGGHRGGICIGEVVGDRVEKRWWRRGGGSEVVEGGCGKRTSDIGCWTRDGRKEAMVESFAVSLPRCILSHAAISFGRPPNVGPYCALERSVDLALSAHPAAF